MIRTASSASRSNRRQIVFFAGLTKTLLHRNVPPPGTESTTRWWPEGSGTRDRTNNIEQGCRTSSMSFVAASLAVYGVTIAGAIWRGGCNRSSLKRHQPTTARTSSRRPIPPIRPVRYPPPSGRVSPCPSCIDSSRLCRHAARDRRVPCRPDRHRPAAAPCAP